jgi:hypothetical protein
MADSNYRWEEISTGRKAFWVIGVAVLMIVAILVVVHGRQVMVVTVDQATFEEEMLRFASISGLDMSSPGSGNALLKGKLIMLNISDRKVDSLFRELPVEMRASTPAEVGTIVWLKRGQRLYGHYRGGGGAYINTCEVTIIDRAAARVLTVKQFDGSLPPSSTKSSSASGSMPSDEITTWLRNLPRR